MSDNPLHAITDAEGRWSIEGLPPGTHVVTAWHPEFGTLEKEAVLAEGESLRVDLEFR